MKWLLLPCLVLMAATGALAGSATWNLNPTNGDWNTAANWTPETVPNRETDVATFGQSNVTDIAVFQTVLGSLIFGPEADSLHIRSPQRHGRGLLSSVWRRRNQ